MGGLQPSAMKLVFVPKCCNSGFFSLKWKLYIMVLHISNINSDEVIPRQCVGMTKLAVILQENFISYLVCGRAFDLHAVLLNSKK